ncbi:MAG: ECF transporter S component [Clostridia bacterium]|nr:ECF transporter S component [Clostridia bacterium]
MIKNHNRLLKMVLSAMFLALAYVLPFLTGQIPEVGSMLCPMHIPVILCGFICGPTWALAIGATAPLLRSLTLHMPPLFPTAVCMALELAAYGVVAGIMHKALPQKKPYVYLSLVISMLVGRLVWGTAMFVCTGINGGAFTFSAFIAGAFTNALPGIIVQIVLIPVLVMVSENKKIIGFKE